MLWHFDSVHTHLCLHLLSYYSMKSLFGLNGKIGSVVSASGRGISIGQFEEYIHTLVGVLIESVFAENYYELTDLVECYGLWKVCSTNSINL